MTIYSIENPLPIAVLISGNGSNLQAIIDAIQQGLPAKVVAVISNNENAYGLQRAQAAHIPTYTVSHKTFTQRELYDEALVNLLKPLQPRLIILAGFMRILTKVFIEAFPYQILNIHPSLLPKYPGLNTYQAAIAAGDEWHGTTVHVVTENLDNGPIIAQARTRIEAHDDIKTLQAKIQRLEHTLYPKIIYLYASGKLKFNLEGITYKGQQLPASGLQFETEPGFLI